MAPSGLTADIGEPVYEDDSEIEPDMGSADSDVSAPDEQGPCAVLWLPSPETRSGWSEYGVYRDAPDEKRRKSIGFK